jgi:hypothetical protein
MFLCRRGFCLANQIKPRATLFCGFALFHHCKIPDALSITQVQLVLHVFTRSCSADDLETVPTLENIRKIKTMRAKASQGARPGVWLCVVAAISLT